MYQICFSWQTESDVFLQRNQYMIVGFNCIFVFVLSPKKEQEDIANKIVYTRAYTYLNEVAPMKHSFRSTGVHCGFVFALQGSTLAVVSLEIA